jgi:hypothetical protein
MLDAGDSFCRYCGEMTEHGAMLVSIGKLPPQTTRKPDAKPASWLESPLVVLPALFFVLGPLALPMLWQSRQFTRAWKIGLTIVVLLVTLVACWSAVEYVNKALGPLLQGLQ